MGWHFRGTGIAGYDLPAEFPRMPTGERYPSASAYEVLSALDARQRDRRPQTWVLRKTERPHFPIDDAAVLERARGEWIAP